MTDRDIIMVSSPHIEHRTVSDDDLLRATIMNKTVVTNSGCWEWQGANTRGYGTIMRNRKIIRVHRLSYELWCEPIPDGMVIRHKCDNPQCVNPSHLETGTQADNIQDIIDRGRFARRKLTLDQVEAIRSSSLPNRELSNAYGVGILAIRRIKNGGSWKRPSNGAEHTGV